MEQKLQLKKISCSNCGAELMFDPGTQMTNCNFCGSKFEIEKMDDEQIIIPHSILPFSVSKEEYEHSVLDWLSEGDYTPDDILDSAIFSSVNGLYLPMWFYQGRYDGNWSASSGYDREEEYIAKSKGKLKTKTRTVTDWRPCSGHCAGEFAVIGYAGTGESIKPKVITYAHGTSIKSINLNNFDAKYTLGFNMLEYVSDENETWDNYGTAVADSLVESRTKVKIPGDRYKDFHVDAIYNKEKPISTYVPYWITYYNYNGKPYSVFMDGTNKTRIEGNKPVDKKRKSTVANWTALPLIIGIIVTILACIIVANTIDKNTNDDPAWAGVFWIGVIVTVVITAIGTMQGQKIVKESKEIRKEKLKQRRANL